MHQPTDARSEQRSCANGELDGTNERTNEGLPVDDERVVADAAAAAAAAAAAGRYEAVAAAAKKSAGDNGEYLRMKHALDSSVKRVSSRQPRANNTLTDILTARVFLYA